MRRGWARARRRPRISTPRSRASASSTHRWCARPPRAPRAGRGSAGDERAFVEPNGVLGGNVLRDFAIALRGPLDEPRHGLALRRVPRHRPAISPIRGGPISRCNSPGGCSAATSPIAARSATTTAASPATTSFAPRATTRCARRGWCSTPAWPRRRAPRATRSIRSTCSRPAPATRTIGPELETACTPADDVTQRGPAGELLVATSVPGRVLFEDSAVRMFGPIDVVAGVQRGRRSRIAPA